MSDYTVTNKPANGSWNVSKVLRDEFTLIQEAVNSKSNKNGISSVSTTSMTIADIVQTFTVEAGKEFTPSMGVIIADAGNLTTNYMVGTLLTYDASTGVITANISSHVGSGTISSWVIGASNQSGVSLVNNTFTGHQNFARATVASHATTADIWNATGNQIDFTGIAAVTDFPDAPQAGAERVLICAGTCSFTASVDMKIDGIPAGGVLSCSADDIVTVRATSTTQFRLSITRYAGNNGGADITSSAVDVTLTSSSGRVQNISMTASNKSVILPPATTVSKGSPLYTIKNSGIYPFDLDKDGGTFLCCLNPGQLVIIGCSDNSTAAGQWTTFGDGLEGISRSMNSEVLNAVDSRNIAVAKLSATKAICAFRDNSTGFLNAVVLNYGSASGTPTAINAEGSVAISIADLSATQAVVVYKTSTGVTKGYVLDTSGNTITPGAVRTIDATTGATGTSLTPISSTQLLLGYYDGVLNTSLERVLTVSASVISEGAETEADSTVANKDYLVVNAISATKVLYSFRGDSPEVILLRLQSISGTTPTPTGSVLTLSTNFTDVSTRFGVEILNANRALVVQAIEGGVWGDFLISLIDISSTSPTLLYNKIISVGIFSSSPTVGSVTRLDDNRVCVVFSGGASMGSDAFTVTASGDDRIFVSTVTEGVELNVTSSSSGGYLDCVALDSSHVMNVCRNSATYLSAKVMEVVF